MANFVINNEGLIKAASDYSSACDDYANKIVNLKTELNNVTAQWKDEVATTWQNLVPETITDLEKIKTNLEYNNNLLKDVAAKASSLQAEIKSEINNLYLSKSA